PAFDGGGDQLDLERGAPVRAQHAGARLPRVAPPALRRPGCAAPCAGRARARQRHADRDHRARRALGDRPPSLARTKRREAHAARLDSRGMRRLALLLGIAFLLAGCGGKQVVSPTAETVIGTIPTTTPAAPPGNAAAGGKLFASQ